MTDWRDTVKTQQELYDEVAELKSKLQAREKLLTIARENEERTAAANRDLVSRLASAEKECEEQARLNGMGAERELALRSRLDTTEKRLAAIKPFVERAAEADGIATMRGWLINLIQNFKRWEHEDGRVVERHERIYGPGEWGQGITPTTSERGTTETRLFCCPTCQEPMICGPTKWELACQCKV